MRRSIFAIAVAFVLAATPVFSAQGAPKAQPTSSTPSDADVTLTPVQQKLERNTNLASKLEARLPAGTDPTDAALGFKNLGQFVAAVNVSNNLHLDFTELKTRMVDRKMSLGQSIQDLRATASPTVEAQRAEYDARVMIAASESESPVTAATTTTPAKKPKKSNKKAVGGAQ